MKVTVYALVKDHRIVWVGNTVGLRKRLASHRRERAFDDYVVLEEVDEDGVWKDMEARWLSMPEPKRDPDERKLLMPVCRDCGVLCEYAADAGDWGLECPKCGAWRCGTEGLKPGKDERAYRRRQRARAMRIAETILDV